MSDAGTTTLSKTAESEIKATAAIIRAQKSVNHEFIHETQKRLLHDHGLSYVESGKLILAELEALLAPDKAVVEQFEKSYGGI